MVIFMHDISFHYMHIQTVQKTKHVSLLSKINNIIKKYITLIKLNFYYSIFLQIHSLFVFDFYKIIL